MGLPAFYVSGPPTVTITDNGFVHVIEKSGIAQLERVSSVGDMEEHIECVRAKIMAWHVAKLRGLQR